MEPCDKDKGCAKRQKIAGVSKTGVVSVINRCSEPKAEHFGKDVGAPQCNTCPFRVQPALVPIVIQSIDVKKKKQTPIIPIDIIDTFPPCDDRREQTVIKCCGQVSKRRVCVCKVSEYNSKEVVERVCEQCPLRVVGGVVVSNLDNGS